jgi:hypothetical protein
MNKNTPSIGVAAILALTAAGCTTSHDIHPHAVTVEAGNAVAANTVMQMVDPWQPGVQDTDLIVPSERGEANADAADDDDSGDTTTDSGSND